ncbi:hypothetical protein D3C71_545630 [compost metagenome]
MTTIATNGKVMYADLRSTNVNPMHFACNECGSTGFGNKQDSKKITVLSNKVEDHRRYIDGKVAMMYGCAGSANLQNFLKGIWPEKSDLRHIVKVLDYINLEKLNIPDGSALIVTEDNAVYRFSISPRKKLFALKEIEETDLPISIGSGSSYFHTYKMSFNVGWFDAFQMAIHRDPHSSTDVYSVAGLVQDKETEKVKVQHKDRVRFHRTYEQTLVIAQRKMKLK